MIIVVLELILSLLIASVSMQLSFTLLPELSIAYMAWAFLVLMVVGFFALHSYSRIRLYGRSEGGEKLWKSWLVFEVIVVCVVGAPMFMGKVEDGLRGPLGLLFIAVPLAACLHTVGLLFVRRNLKKAGEAAVLGIMFPLGVAMAVGIVVVCGAIILTVSAAGVVAVQDSLDSRPYEPFVDAVERQSGETSERIISEGMRELRDTAENILHEDDSASDDSKEKHTSIVRHTAARSNNRFKFNQKVLIFIPIAAVMCCLWLLLLRERTQSQN